jgi:hypothetical protein
VPAVKNGKKKLPVLLGIGFIVAFIIAMLLLTPRKAKFTCEVCMVFNGRTVCRTGGGATREAAQRVASDTACTDLTSGMTPLLQCQSSPPARITWKP